MTSPNQGDSGGSLPSHAASTLRVAAVVNPYAGGGRAAREWPVLERAIRERIPTVKVLASRRPGDIPSVVQEALREGYDRIVAVGGDGTLYEVVNGFFDGPLPINSYASLAIIPIGTGCDFARTIGIPKGLAAVPFVDKRSVRAVDVGRVTLRLPNGAEAAHYFINVADAGMGGAVAHCANQSSKRLGGFITFFLSVLRTLATYRNGRITMEIDGVRVEQVCRDVIIANGQYYGGGMHVAPEAALDSGCFEVFVIGDLNVPNALLKLPKLYLGRLKRDPRVDYFRAKHITLQADQPTLLNLDGEQPGALPATIELVPGALRLVCG